MAKKKGGQKSPSYGFAADDARKKGKGKRSAGMDSYEDTIEPGTVDDFMHKRDQIMFDTHGNVSDEDILDDEGEEVFALPSRRSRVSAAADQEEEDEDQDEDDHIPVKKARKEKVKEDLTGKGRYGKQAIDSDDSDQDQDSADSDSSEDEEGWGRQYYARPSNRREKQDDDDYDEQREADRELEEREVRRLQRKAREALSAQDFGLEDDQETFEGMPNGSGQPDQAEEESAAAVPVPETNDPTVLLRHMETHDPVKLALAREWPLVVQKLEKTQRGMRALEAQKEGQLHKGLGWLHYLTYASTLAFYIHLSALPPPSRPDLSSHPILARLLELKKGLSDLENLDFDAASDDGENPFRPLAWGDVDAGSELSFDSDEEIDLDEDEEDEDQHEQRRLIKQKKKLIKKMQNGMKHGEDEEEEDEEDAWMQEGLEDDELAGLLADAEAPVGREKKSKKAKKEKKTKAARAEEEDEMNLGLGGGMDYGSLLAGLKGITAGEDAEPKSKKPKKEKTKKPKKLAPASTDDTPAALAPVPAFTPLAEPAFVSSSSSTRKRPRVSYEDDLTGESSALLDADAADKETRKRSLAFHTAKIASTAARRAAARERRMGGDEDVPYRDRQAARDAALKRNNRGAGGEGEDLDGKEASERDLRMAREIRGDFDLDDAGNGDGDGDGDGDGLDQEAGDYYDLVKRARSSAKRARQDAHEEEYAERLAGRLGDEEGEAGPRSLTRAIEKNRGLTQRRAKSGRNPRVKKRQAYEKAKQKVASQRAVFKGGQATLGGRYSGEKTGISTVIKSSKF